MTPEERSALRALADDVCSDDDTHRPRIDGRLCACGAYWPCVTVALATAVPALLDENERLAARLDAVRALHYESDLSRYSGECHECCEEWPCPTLRALDGGE